MADPATDTPQVPQPPQAYPSQSDIDKMVSERKQTSDQYIGAVTKLGEERTKLLSTPTPRPPQPHYQDIPKAPQDNYQNVFKESSAGLIFATLLGSMFTRRHGMGALAAATGYMEGFHEGDKEKIERNRQKWSDSVDAIIKQNGVERERYEAVWNNTQLSMQDKQAKLQAIAASVGDQQTISSLRNGDMDFAYKLQEDRNRAAEKLYEANLRWGFGGAGEISEQGLHTMVDQYLAGDKSVLQNIGRGAQGSRNIARFRNLLSDTMTERGITGEMQAHKMQEYTAATAGMAAEQRTGGTTAANLEIIMRNAHAAIPQALEKSEKVPRGKFVPLNKLLQMSQDQISNPELKEFRLANLQLAELWARAMNPRGVMRESDRELALAMLSTADSPETYKRVIATLKSFLEREQKSVREFREGKPMSDTPDAGGAEGWKIERVE